MMQQALNPKPQTYKILKTGILNPAKRCTPFRPLGSEAPGFRVRVQGLGGAKTTCENPKRNCESLTLKLQALETSKMSILYWLGFDKGYDIPGSTGLSPVGATSKVESLRPANIFLTLHTSGLSLLRSLINNKLNS